MTAGDRAVREERESQGGAWALAVLVVASVLLYLVLNWEAVASPAAALWQAVGS